MNEYEATELAYKNGYNKALEDFADKANTLVFDNVDEPDLIVMMYKAVDSIANGLKREANNGENTLRT